MKKEKTCPCCGYCEHCGRSDRPVVMPYIQPRPYPYYVYPYYGDPARPKYGATWYGTNSGGLTQQTGISSQSYASSTMST